MTTANEVLAWLSRRGTKKQIRELDRYGITAKDPFGFTVGELKNYAKQLGTDHDLAHRLWGTARYEARMLASFVDDPEAVTVKQMNAWASDFDNWAIVDTVCFHLFDRTKHAWSRLPQWARARAEFKKRAAFALIWSLGVHDKSSDDARFIESMELIERAADDGRDYVKKAVDMALRAVGKRNQVLNRAAIEAAEGLASGSDPTAKWIGSRALRELRSPKVQKKWAR